MKSIKQIGWLSFLLLLFSCSSYSGKTYQMDNSNQYIKFVDSKTIEWKWSSRFRAEEFEYSIEKKKIRAVRKMFGQVKYLDIMEDGSLSDSHGNIYIEK